MRRRLLWHIGFLAIDAALIGFLAFFAIAHTQLPRVPDPDAMLEPLPGVNVYAQDGTLVYTINRSVDRVGLDAMSPRFLAAVIATEDADFRHHRGISLKAIAGAFVANVRAWRRTRGGSTLTQQIVKNIFLTREKTYLRKVKEAFLAIQLESMFEQRFGDAYKDRLLELYVNGSFYGTNAYGVEDAARTYFGTTAADLTLLQAATLAGLPNAPSAFSPTPGDSASIAAATGRAHHVLRRMVTEGYITSDEARTAMEDSLGLVDQRQPRNRTPYFVETIKSEIFRRWGRSALSFGALDVHTTLDLDFQRAAEQAVERGVVDLDRRLGFEPYSAASSGARATYVQAALLCTDPSTGQVRAMVGGRDIFVSYYNRTTDARRQPGSGFKPIVYLAAFESGMSPLDTFVDSPRTYTVNGKPWSPRNFRDSYLGPTTAAWALIRSANATAVQVADRIGPQSIVDLAERLGVRSPLTPVPSIALGSNEVSMLDMVTAYGAIANYGLRIDPTFIDRIIDRNTGEVLFAYQSRPRPVVDPIHAYTLLGLLRNVVDRGTGAVVRRMGYRAPAAGKTGTTNDNTDAWFTGFSPEYVTSVWIGFDSRTGDRKLVDRRTRAQITGGSGAAPIWADFMLQVNANPTRAFRPPSGTRTLVVDPITGLDPADLDTLTVDPIEITLSGDLIPEAMR